MTSTQPFGVTTTHPDHQASVEQQRRLHPRLWDTDWLVLGGMQSVIGRLASSLVGPGQVVLDFGCGVKPYESLFTQLGASYLGADLGDGHAITIDATGLMHADDNCANLVVSFQVLEHVRDLDTYFREAARVLRPGGQLLLTTHGTWLYHAHPEDHRRWTPMGLRQDLSSRGFHISECIPVVGPLAWTTMIRLTCFAFALRRVPLIGKPLAAALAVAMNAKAWIENKVTPANVTNDNACVYVTLSKPTNTLS
jgi:SAM-dependent methyltransferase